VSRDLVFEEDKCWDWDQIHEKIITVNLEWEDEQNEAVNDEANINEEIEGEIVNSTSDELTNERSPDSTRRIRQQPVWMREYESGTGLSEEEEDMINLAMFATTDPISFAEAMKSEKWRNAMNLEMESIEKNDTWELTDLPAGEKKIGLK